MNRFLPLLALLLASCSGPAGALQTVDIASCYDGDTCTTTAGEKVRLACIDTPELRGRNADPVPAKAARDFLRRAIQGKSVGIRRITEDRYGRTVAELFQGRLNVGELMVSSGHAQIYRRYAGQCEWARSKPLLKSSPHSSNFAHQQ